MPAATLFGRAALALILILPLTACGEDKEASSGAEPVLRGLKTIVVKDTERTTTRKYPSVLQPSSISTLSFEIAGKLEQINLDVGQIVRKGDVLARIDETTLKLQVESARAALKQARSAARTAGEDYERKLILLKQKIIAKATADQSRNAAETAAGQVVQAQKQLEIARKNLAKAVLKAPFDGIINTVEVDSFANVTPGAPIATIYSTDKFEVSFSVSYDVISLLAVGKKATVRLADNPAIALAAHVSELGSRADTVSSFPVVVALDSTAPDLKAGMAVEVSMDFPVVKGKGFTLPLTVLALEGRAARSKPRNGETSEAYVYVFDKATSTVRRRLVTIAGVRENALIITEGLKAGELVAAAGVSFLRDGQKVKLLTKAAGE